MRQKLVGRRIQQAARDERAQGTDMADRQAAVGEEGQETVAVQSFVKEISVGPGKATIRYDIPMPEDGALEGRDTGEVALPGPVRYMVRPGTPGRIRTRDTRFRRPMLCPLSYGRVLASLMGADLDSAKDLRRWDGGVMG